MTFSKLGVYLKIKFTYLSIQGCYAYIRLEIEFTQVGRVGRMSLEVLLRMGVVGPPDW